MSIVVTQKAVSFGRSRCGAALGIARAVGGAVPDGDRSAVMVGAVWPGAVAHGTAACGARTGAVVADQHRVQVFIHCVVLSAKQMVAWGSGARTTRSTNQSANAPHELLVGFGLQPIVAAFDNRGGPSGV